MRPAALALLALVVSLSCCSSAPRPVRVSPAQVTGAPTGSVALLFTRPAKGVTVAIDGELVVDRAHTDSVVISGVTAGLTELRVAAGSGPARLEREMRLEVEVGRTTTVPLGAPDSEESTGYASALFSVAAIVLSTALTNWLF